MRLLSRHVLSVAADQAGLTVEDLTGPARDRSRVFPRHRAMLALRTLRPDLSYPMIGRIFGGRDHSSVIAGCKAAETRARADEDEGAALADLIQTCRRLSSDAEGDRNLVLAHRTATRLDNAIQLVGRVLEDLQLARERAYDLTGDLFADLPRAA